MNFKNSPDKNPRNADTSTIKSAMQELLNTYKIREKFTSTQIIASWERMMGEPIAKRTEKIYIKDKKLFVKLGSRALKQELSYSKEKVKELFLKEFGEDALVDIVFL